MSFETHAVTLIGRLLATFPGKIDLLGSCAIAGNGGEESNGLTAAQEAHPISGGVGGYGWFQWTGPRRKAFFNWCAKAKLDPRTDEANIGFLIYELSTTQTSALTAMAREATLESKTKAFMNTFERPNAKYAHLPVRLEFARRALATWKEKGAASVIKVPAKPLPSILPVPSIQVPPTAVGGIAAATGGAVAKVAGVHDPIWLVGIVIGLFIGYVVVHALLKRRT